MFATFLSILVMDVFCLLLWKKKMRWLYRGVGGRAGLWRWRSSRERMPDRARVPQAVHVGNFLRPGRFDGSSDGLTPGVHRYSIAHYYQDSPTVCMRTWQCRHWPYVSWPRTTVRTATATISLFVFLITVLKFRELDRAERVSSTLAYKEEKKNRHAFCHKDDVASQLYLSS